MVGGVRNADFVDVALVGIYIPISWRTYLLSLM